MACRFSIHANQKPGEAKSVMQKMPMAVEGCPDVYHTGFSSADSFGSTAYLVVREEGNVLVDSPRFHPQLLAQIKVQCFFNTLPTPCILTTLTTREA